MVVDEPGRAPLAEIVALEQVAAPDVEVALGQRRPVDAHVGLGARAELDGAVGEGPGAGDSSDQIELARHEEPGSGRSAISEQVDVEGDRQVLADEVQVDVPSEAKQGQAGVVGARRVAGVEEGGAEEQRTAQPLPLFGDLALAAVRAALLVERRGRSAHEHPTQEDRGAERGSTGHGDAADKAISGFEASRPLARGVSDSRRATYGTIVMPKYGSIHACESAKAQPGNVMPSLAPRSRPKYGPGIQRMPARPEKPGANWTELVMTQVQTPHRPEVSVLAVQKFRSKATEP